MTVHRLQSSSTDAMWPSTPFFSQKSSKMPYTPEFFWSVPWEQPMRWGKRVAPAYNPERQLPSRGIMTMPLCPPPPGQRLRLLTQLSRVALCQRQLAGGLGLSSEVPIDAFHHFRNTRGLGKELIAPTLHGCAARFLSRNERCQKDDRR